MIVTKAQNITAEKALLRCDNYFAKILQLSFFLFAILISMIFVKKLAIKRVI